MLLLIGIFSLLLFLLLGYKFYLENKVSSYIAPTSTEKTMHTLTRLGITISLVSLLVLGIQFINVYRPIGSDSALYTFLIVLLFCILLMIILATSYKAFYNTWINKKLLGISNQNDEPSESLSLDSNVDLQYLNLKNEQEKDSAELLENAIGLFNIQIKECIIPRNEIVALEVNEEIVEVKNTFIESKHSKLIIYENDIDNIIGYVHHSDFYDEPKELEKLVREIPTVPETMTAIEMLSFFKKKQKSIAWVVDEFGGTAGILTTEDLLEELFGEIEDEHDESEYIEQQISSDEIILSGRLEVEYINEKFDLEIPTDSAETISGYIIEVHNAIPDKNEKIVIDNYEYKILQVSKTRIETIRLKVLEV